MSKTAININNEPGNTTTFYSSSRAIPKDESISTNQDEIAVKRGGKAHFRKTDYETIIDWLECPNNHYLIYGKAGQPNNPNVRANRTMGHKMLAAMVSKKSNGRLQLEGKAMRERLGRVMALFLRAMGMTTKKGFELTKDDHAKGILTLSAKQKSLCPCYARVETIFTENPVFLSNSSEATKDVATTDKLSDTEVRIKSHERDTDYGKGPRRMIADESEEEAEEEAGFAENDDGDSPTDGNFEVDPDTGVASGSLTDVQPMVDSATRSRNEKRPLLTVRDSNCAKRPRLPLVPVEQPAETRTDPSADV
ncbi:hypothetical protein BG011_006230 [Mortierella polycephala]|uniref:Uncharacterized protein n=1 Tax=Mortierella polycephala TaxID=41804 RepID=A0A9P6PU48_9FUNG|nr:hypothetical protein BG011_006230 [Mortierella polycephala]